MNREDKYNIINGVRLDGLIGQRIKIDYEWLFMVEGVLTSIGTGKEIGEPIFFFRDTKFSLPGDWLWYSTRIGKYPKDKNDFEFNLQRLKLWGYQDSRFRPNIGYKHPVSGREAMIDGKKKAVDVIIEIEVVE